MTLPNERTRAVIRAREFLWRLASPSGLKRIPRAVREEAGNLLRHFPHWCDLCQSEPFDVATATEAGLQSDQDWLRLIEEPDEGP